MLVWLTYDSDSGSFKFFAYRSLNTFKVHQTGFYIHYVVYVQVLQIHATKPQKKKPKKKKKENRENKGARGLIDQSATVISPTFFSYNDNWRWVNHRR